MADEAQWPQNPEHSDDLQETEVLASETHVDNTEEDDNEIQLGPGVSNVGVEIEDKA